VSLALLVVAPGAVADDVNDFDFQLSRVDRALRKNPARVPEQAVESCRSRRNAAVHLFGSGQRVRAMRRLKYCRQVLGIPDEVPVAVARATAPPTVEEVAAKAAKEVEQALALTPDPEQGLEIYRGCAACHMPEGWGLPMGTVPQIAGQHRSVVIKQLADIRAGNRDNLTMLPYSSVESIGGAQAIADVAAYIDTLELTVANGKGPGDDLALGQRLYKENCERCHGATGQGDNETYAPRIHAQHYEYLLRQFQWIRDGKRRNANAEMAAQIRDFGDRETRAVLDYVSRLTPPEELTAPDGWHNPDFARADAGQ
jgi:cytochrome c553